MYGEHNFYILWNSRIFSTNQFVIVIKPTYINYEFFAPQTRDLYTSFLHFRPRKHGPSNYRYQWAVHSTESGSRLNLNSGFKLPRIIVNFLNELTSRLTIVVSCSSCHALVSGPTDYGRSLIRSTLMNPLLIQYFIIRIWSMLLRILFKWKFFFLNKYWYIKKKTIENLFWFWCIWIFKMSMQYFFDWYRFKVT